MRASTAGWTGLELTISAILPARLGETDFLSDLLVKGFVWVAFLEVALLALFLAGGNSTILAALGVTFSVQYHAPFAKAQACPSLAVP